MTLCPLARPKKAIGHESQIGPWLAILQSLCLSVSRNEWAPSRQGNGTTGRKRNLTVSCDETKHETTSPEQDHSPIASARLNGWAECRDEKSVGTEPTKRNIFDIPFYRTFWRGTTSADFLIRRNGSHIAVEVLRKRGDN